jgi:hypothetical protein
MGTTFSEILIVYFLYCVCIYMCICTYIYIYICFFFLDDLDLSNPYIQHRITQGISKITTDLNTGNTHGIIVMLDNDMLTYYICQFLVEQLQLVHVQAV